MILEDAEDFQLRDKYLFATKSVVRTVSTVLVTYCCGHREQGLGS